MNTFQSEYGQLKSMLVKHPRNAYINEENVRNQWEKLHYTSKPDLNKAFDEYDAFLEIFSSNGVEIHNLETSNSGLDSIYVRDASISTNMGMIMCNMGKGARVGEPSGQLAFYESEGIPVRGIIEGEATLEGGDVAWVDESTLAIAWGYRSNKGGIYKLKEILKDSAEEVIVVPSPHYRGPTDVFHLMSVYSPIDKNLAVVYSPLMSVPFRQELLRRGVELVEVPEQEFDSLGCNVLAIAPSVCVIASGNPLTQSRLEKAGVDVITYKGEEISLKGNGGPTCLTRPLIREV
jgi:N-dimethylarginine dimethylaminohydrolase